MKDKSNLPDRLTPPQRAQALAILEESEISLISCLFWWMDDRYIIHKRRLHDSFLYFPTKGRFRCQLEDDEVVIGPGEFLMVGEGIEHEAFLTDDCSYLEVFAVHTHAYALHGQPVLNVFESHVGRLTSPQLWFEQLELLTHLMGINHELGRAYGEPWLRQLFLHQIMQGSTMQEHPTATDPRLWDSLRIMMESYASPLTVNRLAKRVGLSEGHFRRLFREHTGMTPKAYLQQLRLRKARALLQTNILLTVKEVAEQTGFCDAQYFHYVFKQAYGITPAACRREPAMDV